MRSRSFAKERLTLETQGNSSLANADASIAAVFGEMPGLAVMLQALSVGLHRRHSVVLLIGVLAVLTAAEPPRNCEVVRM